MVGTMDWTLLMEGLDPNVVDGRGLEGTSIGRIQSMLLLLIVPIDAVVVVGRVGRGVVAGRVGRDIVAGRVGRDINWKG